VKCRRSVLIGDKVALWAVSVKDATEVTRFGAFKPRVLRGGSWRDGVSRTSQPEA